MGARKHIDASGMSSDVAEATPIDFQAMHTPQIDEDFCGWLVDQASALRKRQPVSLDWDHLAEELEDMAAAQKGELVKRLATLFEHFLKMAFQPEERRARKRKVTIVKTRNAIDELLKRSPGLKGQIEALAREAYAYGSKQAGTALGMSRRQWEQQFPAVAPWNLEQLLDEDFFPEPINLSDDK